MSTLYARCILMTPVPDGLIGGGASSGQSGIIEQPATDMPGSEAAPGASSDEEALQQLRGEMARLTTFVERAVNAQQCAASRTTALRGQVGALEGDLASAHRELAETRAALAREQQRTANAAEAVRTARILASCAEQANQVIAGARQMLAALAVPGTGSAQVFTAIAQLERASALIATGSAVPAAPQLVELLGEDFSSRLAAAFPDAPPAEILREGYALQSAMEILLASTDVRYAQALVDRTLAMLRSTEAGAWEVRGCVHEVIRLGHLLRSGRLLDSVSHVFTFSKIDGWAVDQFSGRIVERRVSGTAEIDARSGEALIETKAQRFDGNIGTILPTLLDQGALLASRTADACGTNGKCAEAVRLAVCTANQLLRYRTLIARGIGRLFELHITSDDRVPPPVVDAIHRFFGANVAKVFWYRNDLCAQGVLLEPTEECHAPSSRQRSTPIPPAAPTPVPPPSAAPAPVPTPEKAVVPEPPPVPSKSATPPAAPEPRGRARKSAVPPPPQGPSPLEDQRAMLYQMVYGSQIAAAAGFNRGVLEAFVTWVETSGPWPVTLSKLQGLAREEALSQLYHTWNQNRANGSAPPSAGPKPWEGIHNDRAEARFNKIFRTVVGKQTLDWSQRVTKGIQNNNIIQTLRWIQDQPKVASDQGLREAIGRFIDEMGKKYKPASYFKTAEDGPALRDLMKRYIYVTEGRRN